MNKRILGRTGIAVSEIAFGGVEIGMPYGIGVNSAEDMISESDAIHLLGAAVDSGINFFDTARMYGDSERIMGKAFKERRGQVVLSTKCVHFRQADGSLPDDPKLKVIIKDSLAESLRALQTGFVDVFMLHTADEEILDNLVVAQVFSELKAAGLTRAIGVSTYLPAETEKAISAGIWDVIQVPFNLMDQRQAEFLTLAAASGIGVMVRSVLMKGLLSDRGKNLHPALKKVEDHLSAYNGLLKEGSGDLPSLAVRFALSFKEVSAALIGIDSMEYLNKSLALANGIYLDKEQMARARALAYPDPPFLNLNVWSRQGWLK